MYIPGLRVLSQVCEALGIDPKTNGIKRIALIFEMDNAVRAEITRFVHSAEITDILSLVERMDKPSIVEK